MVQYHPWAGEAHDGAYLFAVGWGIAMRGAFFASCFVLSIAACIEFFFRVFQ